MIVDMTVDEVEREMILSRLPDKCCGRCQHWARKTPDDVSAPEGKCGIPEWDGHWPTGYWPNTLQRDKCSSFELA